MLLKNAVVYDGEFLPVRANVAVEGTLIRSLETPGKSGEGSEALDLSGMTLLPGFIDIHIHGCAGADACDATPEALEAISACLAQRGVTSFCPTSMTLPYEQLEQVFTNVRLCRDNLPGAYAHGINMEGPYISPAKKGAQNGAFVRPPDIEEFRQLYSAAGGCIKLVDIAPEEAGAMDFIREIQPICPVSVAHTNADYDTVCEAFMWGARHATHLFNAMNGLNHRAPGAVGAVFDKARELGVRAELICDGFHIHPAVLRLAFALLGEELPVVVSDSMRAAGHADGEYTLGGQKVWVKKGRALLEDGTIAASTTNLLEEFRNLLGWGIPMRQAVKAVTNNPARAIRADGVTGSIEPGKLADLVALDEELRVRLVLVRGQIKVNNL